MELGTLQIQIFVSLVVVLGTAFVAFLCDFLKGNNEQLRERNIEMRVRQDERERIGIAHPGSLLKGIEALLRNTPGLRVAPAEEVAPMAAPVEPETLQPSTWEQPIVAPAAKGSAWASKEELEKLAERAARIRERHEARKAADDFAEDEPAVLAPVAEMPAPSVAGLEQVLTETLPEEPLTEETLTEGVPAGETSAEVAQTNLSDAAFAEATANEVDAATSEFTAVEITAAETAVAETATVEIATRATVTGEETPPPLMVEASGVSASAEAEATPVLEPVAADVPEVPALDEAALEAAALEEPAVAESALDELAVEESAVEELVVEETVVEERSADEPASQIELQPLAIAHIESFDAPHSAIMAVGEEPAAITPGPELVMKPMATATIVPSEPEELLAVEETAVPEGETEPELLRVRVVPIDQPAPAEIPVEALASEPISETDVAPAEIVPLELAQAELVPVELVPVEESAAAGPEQPEPEQIEAEPISVSELENAAGIGALHESLVTEEPGLPAGLHAAEVLREQIKANAPFQGVSVSIGINDYEGLKQKLDTAGGADSLAAIEKMIRGMLKEPDFACRFQDDEYILLFPGESDSAAQRRLFQISEKLWDFQLRSLGHHSIMFSWGGLEVKRDSLSDAVSAARERMFQTKRNRTGAIEMRKRVVNG